MVSRLLLCFDRRACTVVRGQRWPRATSRRWRRCTQRSAQSSAPCECITATLEESRCVLSRYICVCDELLATCSSEKVSHLRSSLRSHSRADRRLRAHLRYIRLQETVRTTLRSFSGHFRQLVDFLESSEHRTCLLPKRTLHTCLRVGKLPGCECTGHTKHGFVSPLQYYQPYHTSHYGD